MSRVSHELSQVTRRREKREEGKGDAFEGFGLPQPGYPLKRSSFIIDTKELKPYRHKDNVLMQLEELLWTNDEISKLLNRAIFNPITE